MAVLYASCPVEQAALQMRRVMRAPFLPRRSIEVGDQLVAEQVEGSRIAKERGFIGGDGFNYFAAEVAGRVRPHLEEQLREVCRSGFGQQAAQARLDEITFGIVQLNPANFVDVSGPDRQLLARDGSDQIRPPLTKAVMRLAMEFNGRTTSVTPASTAALGMP